MKKYLAIALLSTSFAFTSSATMAAGIVVTFDGTAPAGGSTFFGTNGSYTESGFTLTATNTDFYSFSKSYTGPNSPSFNNTDFAFFANNTTGVTSASLSATTPFSLLGFAAANLGLQASSTLSVTGHLVGGGTAMTQFITAGNNQWTWFTLDSRFTNLSSVDFYSNGNYLALDNITATPIPAAVWLFGSGVLGLLGLGKRKNKTA